MNNKMRIIIGVLIILSLSTVSIGKEIVSKQLLDSEYGAVGDWLNIGNRFYRVTYDDGTSEELIVAGSPFLKTAAITEYVSSGTVYSSQCYKALLQYRVKTIQDGAKSYSTNHKMEVWRNDYEMSISAIEREFPNWKVASVPDFQASETFSVLQSIQVPWEPGYQDYRMEFDVVEYQQKLDGTWVRIVPGIATMTRASIKWWTTYQSGSGRGDLISGCSGAPLPPVPSTPTPPTSISISSNPSGATVSSSGSVIGTTPFSLSLSSGESKILTFTKTGYVSQYVGASSSIPSVSVTLQAVAVPIPTPVPTPYPTAAPTAVVTSAPTQPPPVLTPIVTTVPTAAPSTITTVPGATTPAPTSGITLSPDRDEIGISYLPIAIIVIVLGGGAYIMLGKKKGKKRK